MFSPMLMGNKSDNVNVEYSIVRTVTIDLAKLEQ